MKKLMMAAAVAAVAGGAVAANNPLVYNIKYSLKTLQPKAIVCEEGSCTICEEEIEWSNNYFELGSRKIEALLASCDTCDNTVEGENSLFLVWDATAKKAISGMIKSTDKTLAAALLNDTIDNPVRMRNRFAKNNDGSYNVEEIQPYSCVTNWTPVTPATSLAPTLCSGTVETNPRIAVTNGYDYARYEVELFGKKVNKAAVVLDFGYPCRQYIEGEGDTRWSEIRSVGFGSWDLTKKCLKSATGNANGFIHLLNKNEDNFGASLAGYIVRFNSICDDEFDYCRGVGMYKPTNIVPAYGTFSIKKNASAAKKYIYQLVPECMYK